MCEYSGKLIAWLDRELDEEVIEMERHIRECSECRSRLGKYEQMSKTFDAYCDAVASVKVRRSPSQWLAVLSAAATVIIAATLALTFPRTRKEPPAVPAIVASAPAAVILEPTPAPTPTKRVQRVRPRAASALRVHPQTANWLPAEPAVQVAIPADAMFPPGAFPEGVNFAADVSFAPDGSAQQIRLRPRLIRFEKRGNQP